ncbi:MAG: flagellar hook protein FlgE [Alphaproteobacteria bacterium]|nr:flagellar hook protein FlgE [Alphaproteobacteria bacterium]
MSLFSALTVAVGGLAAQSSAIGNISDNLANTSTTGYKSINTSFETLVTSSNLQRNDPGGVRATPQYQNDVQGNLIQSQVSTSLAITGQGYFEVRPSTVGAAGTTTFGSDSYYTRRGDFSLDKNGYLVNGAGFFLTGYQVSSTGIVDTSKADPIQISQLLDNPVPTSTATYSANLPSSAEDAYSSAPSTIQIYDALGNGHDMSFTWTKDSTNNWTLNVLIPEAVAPVAPSTIYTDYDVDIPFIFNSVTNVGTIETITPDTVVPARYTVVTPGSDNKAEVSYSLSFAGSGSQTVTIDFGTYDSPTGTTQFADTTVAVTSFEQNGIPRGSFKDLSIDKNGFITLNYDNGRSKTFYQIPLVQFFAQDQLQRISGGAYQRTIESGTARRSAPGSVGAGQIVGSSLEGSNVDIATEFTKLIQAQRVYSANAKTITTSDSMLQEVINIIR